MPMDRSPLITDAPRGHSPAARIARLTRERDALLVACKYTLAFVTRVEQERGIVHPAAKVFDVLRDAIAQAESGT